MKTKNTGKRIEIQMTGDKECKPSIHGCEAEEAAKGQLNPINNFSEGLEKPSLLLHSCCGPCSTSVVERLAGEYHITLFFYKLIIQGHGTVTRKMVFAVYMQVYLAAGERTELTLCI